VGFPFPEVQNYNQQCKVVFYVWLTAYKSLCVVNEADCEHSMTQIRYTLS